MNIFCRRPTWSAVVPPETQRAVNQAIGQIVFVARAYDLPAFASDTDRESWQHDLGLELANGNLKSLQLQLIDAAGSVLFNYQLRFNGTADSRPLLDSAQGVELPLIERRQVARTRLSYTQDKWPSDQVPYRHLFRHSWSKADPLPRRTGDTLHTEHAASISGGRLAGRIELDSALRRGLVVTSVGSRGFAFARDASGELDGIFLHPNFSQPGLSFSAGQRLSALVIQTPRGLQGREIRAA